MTLEALYIAAAMITIGGAGFGIIRIYTRRVERRRAQHADLEHLVGAFIGAALAAHGRLVMLAHMKRSWIPISERAVLTLGNLLLSEMRPLAELHSHIRTHGDRAINAAADDVISVLEDTSARLARGRMAVRRAIMDDSQASLEEAILKLHRAGSQR